MQQDCFRLWLRKPFEQRQVSSGILPAAESQSADGSSNPTRDYRASPAESRLARCPAKASSDPQYHTHRHTEADQVSNQLRKFILSIVQHIDGGDGARPN